MNSVIDPTAIPYVVMSWFVALTAFNIALWGIIELEGALEVEI